MAFWQTQYTQEIINTTCLILKLLPLNLISIPERPSGLLLCHSRGDTSEHGWQQRLFSMKSFPLGHTVAMPSPHLKNQHLLLNKTALSSHTSTPSPSKNCSKSLTPPCLRFQYQSPGGLDTMK